MVKQYKVDRVASLVEKLNEKSNFILTNYSGTKVKDLSLLRKSLREKEADYKVVKNNLFQRALQQGGYQEIDNFLKGPIGVAFFKDNIGEIAKIFKDFSKEQKNFEFSIGCYDSVVYDQDKIKKISEIPSMDVLLGQIMSLINAPASKVAMGMNQVMASLARGIKAVAESNNKE